MLCLQKQKCLTNIVLHDCAKIKFPVWGIFYAKNLFLPPLYHVLHIFFDKTLDFIYKKHIICINFLSNDVNK